MTVKIYDTTLRDGNQARGLSFSLADKLMATERLIDFGVDYIEGGWPNPTSELDVEYFKKVKSLNHQKTKIAAFGSTRRPKNSVEDDVILNSLVRAETEVITIFGKSWDLHATDVIRVGLEENLEMIESSIAYLKKYADEVFYDAEHFFDGYKANPEYALQTLLAAQKGGADCLVLADTNGGMALPWEFKEIIESVKSAIDVPFGIHTHNDTGAAVVNSVSAVEYGAQQVQGTINGYGERCGNANLITIIPNLVLKMGKDLTCAENLKDLRNLSVNLDEILNLPNDIRVPYVGEAAFAHKGGAHVDGVMKVQHSFEHIDPSLVGNNREFILSDQAGGSLVVDRLKAVVPDVDKKDPAVKELLAEVKEMENEGFHFETAGATFELMAAKKLGKFKHPIEVVGYRVIEERRANGLSVSESSIKIRVDGDVSHRVAEGDGPVNALDGALRLALEKYFPYVGEVKLKDYKVRVLGDNVGTDAKVRVWTTFGDGDTTWNTAGVSTNIVEASFTALLDGLSYKIMKENI
ncbi:MAG: citramalate synthase [Fibrobacterales bacterium]